MNVDRYVHAVAGMFVLISLALGHWVSAYWYWFTTFVGLNLFQSGLTGWCFLSTILRKLGVPDQSPTRGADRAGATNIG